MQKSRQLPSVAIGLALLFTAHAAVAVGWMRAQQSAVLGQPLDFTAVLRLDPGDNVDPDCIAADVVIGDQRVQPGSVRVQVDGSRADSLAMRVSTTQPVDEPLVAVQIAIGCPARMSRRFVLLADPPGGATPVMLAVAAAPVTATAGAAAAATVAAGADDRPPQRQLQPQPRRVERVARTEPRSDPVTRERHRPRRVVAAAEPVAAAQPRLRLEPETAAPAATAVSASLIDDAIEAVALAASAARASAAAASAAERRIAALEQTVADLRAQSSQNRELAAQLRARPADADAGRWLLPLLLALLALLALAAWLAWRMRALERERQRGWRRSADMPATRPPPTPSQLPLVTAELAAPGTRSGADLAPGTRSGADLASPATRSGAPATVPAPPVTQQQPPPAPRPAAPMPTEPPSPTAMERTQTLPPPDGSQPRDVSIDELLDLEQQAEFFIVLGQDDAAVELLVEHLRSTGGGSPLPYLKLLEIERRRGDREAYERTRARFNHRFNAYAPDWDTDLAHGRSLEDYPGVLPRLQQIWPRPLDAMAELEALLFRKSRGELFELPAYREVLFLYALARDLLDREGAAGGNVDLLLPLADGGEFSATSPHPYFGLERDSVFDTLSIEDRPTQPVDLDLTQPDTRPMIELPPATPPARGPGGKSGPGQAF